MDEVGSFDLKKAALRQASLRWHPDKFLAKYGAYLVPEERARIVQGVHEMNHRVSALRQRLQTEQSKMPSLVYNKRE